MHFILIIILKKITRINIFGFHYINSIYKILSKKKSTKEYFIRFIRNKFLKIKLFLYNISFINNKSKLFYIFSFFS